MPECPSCERDKPDREYRHGFHRSPLRTIRCIECEWDNPTKWCSDCRQWKPRTEYYSNRSKSDGLQPVCVPCMKSRVGASA